MSKKKVLIIGATGFLGKKCYTLFKKQFNVAGTFFNRPLQGLKKLDIRSNREVQKIMNYTNPDIVVHTAAMINIEKCEKNKNDAWEINVNATKNIVQSCKKNGAKLVYISSDYIFKGDDGPYYEDSDPEPLNYYGMTKLEAERLIEDELFDYAIIRPTVLDGFNTFEDTSFLNSVIGKLRRNEKVQLDNHLLKYPVLIDDVAGLIRDVIINDSTGIFHIGSKEHTTRYDWAMKIAKHFKLEASNISVGDSYSSAVVRPINVNLLTHHSNIYNKYFTQNLNKSLRYSDMLKNCSFNYFYSYYPEDNVSGESIAQIRIQAGKKLANKYPCNADMIIPIPESGIFLAVGYSIESGIPYVPAIVRNDNVDRTLFETDLENRVKMVNEKLKVIKELVVGKNVVLIDEAIISGTTTQRIISKLKEAGAKEIHIRIPVPIVLNNCDANNMPNTDKLLSMNIGNKKGEYNQKFEDYLQADTIQFMNKDEFLSCFNTGSTKCVKCLTKGE